MECRQCHLYLSLPNLKSTHLHKLPKFLLCFDFSEQNYFPLPFNVSQFAMSKRPGDSRSSLYRALGLMCLDTFKKKWIETFDHFQCTW